MTPAVSVIIPAFNRADVLGRAIDSVLAQTYPDFELIVVDDGSTDRTAEVVQTFADPRIRYIPQANAGVAAARNTGLAEARGRFVAFLDSDDRFLPHKLAVQVAVLEASPEVGLVAGGYRVVSASGEPLIERHPWHAWPRLDVQTWLYACPVTVHSVLVRREWLARAGGFDLSLNGQAEDWDLWLRLAYAGCLMAWTPEVVCVYHLHPGQRVRDGLGQRNSALALLTRFFQQPDLPAELAAQQPAVFAAAHHSAALREYAAGQVETARKDLEMALALDPALLQGDPPPLLFIVAAWASDPLLVEDPVRFVPYFLDNLPPAAAPLVRFKDRLLWTVVSYTVFDAVLSGNLPLARRVLAAVEQSGDFPAVSPAWLVEILVDSAPAEAELQHRAIGGFFAALPESWHGLRAYRRRVLGRLWAARGFGAVETEHYRQAAPAFWRAVRYDPSWLGNRGIWSVWLRAIKG